MSTRVSRRWRYPGLGWCLAATLLPPLLCQYLGYSPTGIDAFAFASEWQLWLLCFRSALYTAVLTAESPVTSARHRLGSLDVCRPLWGELGAVLGFDLIFYGRFGGLGVSLIGTTALVLLTASLLFAALGLRVGFRMAAPVRAAARTRRHVTMLLLVTTLLEKILVTPVVMALVASEWLGWFEGRPGRGCALA